MTETVRDVGEQGLLQLVQQFCPVGVVGDDAALVAIAPEHSLVVTTDMLVDGVHFSLGLASPGLVTTSPADVGWRSAAANLSDLAAMGAEPLGITVALSLPGRMPIAWVRSLYEGLQQCLSPFNTAIVGGDLCRSDVVTVAIAAFGQVQPEFAIRRTGALPGDVIWVTGVHGASRAGLELLLHPELGRELKESDRASLIAAHQRPRPRLDVTPLLRQAFEQVNLPFHVGGMDSSDGLADAIVQLCRCSGVGAQVDRQSIPLPAELKQWRSEDEAIEWALYGGEDFELVLCLPSVVAEWMNERVEGAAIVGRITKSREVVVYDSLRIVPDISLALSKGFQHF